jgi:hypothetical protein
MKTVDRGVGYDWYGKDLGGFHQTLSCQNVGDNILPAYRFE